MYGHIRFIIKIHEVDKFFLKSLVNRYKIRNEADGH